MGKHTLSLDGNKLKLKTPVSAGPSGAQHVKHVAVRGRNKWGENESSVAYQVARDDVNLDGIVT